MVKKNILKDQKKRLYTVFAIVGVICAVVLYFVLDGDSSVPGQSQAKKIDLPTDSMNPQENWNIQTGDQLTALNQKLGLVQDIMLEQKAREEQSNREKAEITQRLFDLEKKFAEKQQELLELKTSTSEKKRNTPSFSPFMEEGECLQSTKKQRKPLVVKNADISKNKVKHVDKTIPAGTTVKAVMVSSVDAPCGAFSSSDPQPVKLQILDDGHLPKAVRAKLKGGIIIASAYGDLSSERLYLRIERLTQVKPNGNFVETTVTGFVTGEDGKYGVRGSVVDRSGTLVKNAATAGVFSGASNFFQAYASTVWNPWGYGCGPCRPGCDEFQYSSKELAYGMAAQGGAEGAQNAFDTLTDYYIRRAELIKPVIQVNAGRIVDITFTLGTEIGDLHATDNCEKVRKNSRG